MTPPAPRLSAGVLTADLTRLGAELEILRGKAAWAHVDVMDGVFCPQLTVGPAFVAAVASTGIAGRRPPDGRGAAPAAARDRGGRGLGDHRARRGDRHLHRTMAEMTATGRARA